jgi:TonB family protein
MTTANPASLNRIIGAVLALAVAFTLGFVVRSQLPMERESHDTVEAAALEVLRHVTAPTEAPAPAASAMVGAGFQPLPPGATRPVKVHDVAPEYTELAREARIQGVVILQTAIDQDGHVVDVKVLKGLHMGLTEAAVDAVKQWKFEPATIDGEPIPVSYNVTVNFRLGKIG